jgi:ABC-2 type transport system permease protein
LERNKKISYKMIHSLSKVFQRELKRISGDAVYPFFLVIGPLIAFSLVSLIFSSNVPSKLPVGIVDLDHTNLSRKITRMTDATSIAAVDRSYISLKEAYRSMVKGKIDAIICVPEGTEKNILRGKSSEIAVYINNEYLIKGGLLSSGIQKALGTLSAGIRFQSHLMNGSTEQQALSEIMPVQLRPVLLFNPYTSYSYYLTVLLVPVMLTVFILFGTLYALGTELQYGTGPEWLEAAGSNIFTALTGKLVIYTILFSVLALLIDLILFKILGLPLNGQFSLILAGEFLMILSYQFMAVFIITLTRNLRLGLSVASAYTMLALTYAGLTYPLFGMPVIAKVISRIFPFTYWLELFTGQSLRGEPIACGLIQLFYLCGFIFLGTCLIPRLKYILETKKFWGRI